MIKHYFFLKRGIFFIVIFVSISLLDASSKFSQPLKLAIDIGHTPKRFGCISSRGDTEYEFNKAIATMLYSKLLTNSSIEGMLINKESKEISLKQRVKLAKKVKADLFISIHHDSVQKKYLKNWVVNGVNNLYCDKFSGYSLLVSNKNKYPIKSINLASKIAISFQKRGLNYTLHHAEKIKGESRKWISKDFGIYTADNLVVLKYVSMPSVLVECGVIVNREEEELVKSKDYMDKITNSIIEAILSYKLSQ